MLKRLTNKKIPLAVSSGLILLALLSSTLLTLRWTGWLGRVTGKFSESSSLQQQRESKVLPLVSLPIQQRGSQLEEIASAGKSGDRHRARYLLASDLIAQKQGEKALQWLAGLEQDYPVLAPQIAFKRAQAYQASGNKAKAEAALHELIERYPNSPVVADALYLLGKENPKYLDQAIAQFPYHPRTLEIVRDRLKANPNQPQLLLLLAKYTPNEPGMDAVRDRLVNEFSSGLTPQDWEAIASGYWETWKYGKAGDAYAKAPSTPRNAYRAARGRHIDGKIVQAKAAYQQLITQFPDAKETGLGLRHLASLSQPTEALDYLDLVAWKFPDEAPAALLAKAKILDALNSGTSAAQARELLLTKYANSDVAAEYRWGIAQEKAAAGNLTEALQWAQPITINNPSSDLAPKAGFWIGKWAWELGQQQEAKASFSHVLAHYPESYYAWRSAVLLGLDVGDFTTIRQVVPQVVKPTTRPIPPTGSDSFKELYLLGQDQDAWRIWQAETADKPELGVAEQFTDGLIRIALGKNLQGINQIWNLQQRETPEDIAQWQILRQQPDYWYALFPFPFESTILNWSKQRQLNPLLVTSLVRQESRFEPEIRSIAGAAGLMQVMPGTAEWIAPQISLKDYSLTNPEDNVNLGTWYLDHTHQTYANNSLLAVASYNAGPGNVSKWIREYPVSDPDVFVENIPFPETKGYVESVFGNYWNYLRLYNREVSQMMSEYVEKE